MKLLLTGATGFLGSRLLFLEHKHDVGVLGRSCPKGFVGDYFSASLGEGVDYTVALYGVEVVIHCAARAHIMKDESLDPLAEYRRVNVDGTLNLARQATGAGVKRFIYISTIKVNGEETVGGMKFCAEDSPAPEDPYGLTKAEAEKQLLELGQETGMEIVVIRPPLVYGPGVKGNFLSMLSWLSKGVPLPLGAINNKRSLVGLTNLVDLIVRCIDHPAAANQIFLAGDGEDVSTTELLEKLSFAFSKKPRIIPVPESLLTFGASILGRRNVAQRLCGSLQVDISKAQELLEWTPPVSMAQELQLTVDYYLQHLKK